MTSADRQYNDDISTQTDRHAVVTIYRKRPDVAAPLGAAAAKLSPVALEVARDRDASGLREIGLFLVSFGSFLCVCPEPVLIK